MKCFSEEVEEADAASAARLVGDAWEDRAPQGLEAAVCAPAAGIRLITSLANPATTTSVQSVVRRWLGSSRTFTY